MNEFMELMFSTPWVYLVYFVAAYFVMGFLFLMMTVMHMFDLSGSEYYEENVSWWQFIILALSCVFVAPGYLFYLLVEYTAKAVWCKLRRRRG